MFRLKERLKEKKRKKRKEKFVIFSTNQTFL